MRKTNPVARVTSHISRRRTAHSTSGTLRQVQDLMDRLDLLELQRLLEDSGMFPDGERALRFVSERWKPGADLDARLVASWRNAG